MVKNNESRLRREPAKTNQSPNPPRSTPAGANTSSLNKANDTGTVLPQEKLGGIALNQRMDSIKKAAVLVKPRSSIKGVSANCLAIRISFKTTNAGKVVAVQGASREAEKRDSETVGVNQVRCFRNTRNTSEYRLEYLFGITETGDWRAEIILEFGNRIKYDVQRTRNLRSEARIKYGVPGTPLEA